MALKAAPAALALALTLAISLEPLAATEGARLADGARLAADPQAGDCGICHHLPGYDARDQGTVGPPLAGVGSRLNRATLEALMTDARALRPGSIMPRYGVSATAPRVPGVLQGKALLSPSERAAIVAWLESLKAPTQATPHG
ncbi:MAG: hypothetical protein RLZZ174_417 [Pseudomonadota bacterium]